MAVLLLGKVPRNGWFALVGGTVVGALPLVIHDLALALRYSAVPTFLGLNGGGPDASWADKLHGGVLTGIPLATGMCAPGRCEPYQLWFAPLWLLLLVVASYGAWRFFRQSDRVRGAWPSSRRRCSNVLVYVRANAAGNTPIELRYLLPADLDAGAVVAAMVAGAG